MKSYYVKEVTPNDMVTRNRLLRKLASLRNQKSKSLVEIKRAIKARIRLTYGATSYYRYHKGLQIFLGDETTAKKQFLMYRDVDDVRVRLNNHRARIKRPNYVFREKVIEKTAVAYKVLGGVMVNANVFGSNNRKIRRQKVYKPKYPSANDSYIGIEIEFASALPLELVADMIAEKGLHDCVRAMRDSSIATNSRYQHQIEICILTKFSELENNLNRLATVLTPDIFEVNASCGLHVHLDARHDDNVSTMYKNLVSVQSVLFGMVHESRRENRYCHPVPDVPFEHSDLRDHYAAISYSSYFKHKTIEVRMHQATLDLTRVKNWVKLLKRISEYKGAQPLKLGTIASEIAQLKEQVQIEPDLIEFIYQQTGS